MSLFEVWKASISAQKALTSLYSEPFRLRMICESSPTRYEFEVEKIEPLRLILPHLEQTFPEVEIKRIFLDRGYLIYSAYSPVNDLNELERVARSYCFEFSSNPCFSGDVTIDAEPYEEFISKVGIIPNEQGEVFATARQIERLDSLIDSNPRYSRENEIAALLKISPHEEYYASEQEIALRYLSENLGIESIYVKKGNYEIGLKNTFLFAQARDRLKEISAYHLNHHKLYYRIAEHALSEFEESRLSKNIFYTNEEVDNAQRGIILPKLVDGAFVVTVGGHVDSEELREEIFFYSHVIERYFSKDDISFEHFQIFRQDRAVFYERLKGNPELEDYNIGLNSEIIAFEFCEHEEFQKKLEKLDKIDVGKLNYLGNEHKFKVKLSFKSPLESLLDKLTTIPSVSGFLSADKKSLRFVCSFSNPDQQMLLRSRVQDLVNIHKPKNAELSFENLEEGYIKYHLRFKEDEYLKAEKEKFAYLQGDNISLKTENGELAKGQLIGIDYPSLLISFEDESISAEFKNNWVYAQCELRGEKDKIKRLSDATDLIFGKGASPTLNDHVLAFLKEGEVKANRISHVSPAVFRRLKLEVYRNSLSSFLNEKQIEAVCKSLLAKDVFMIQGPPGTGKSTAIAEIVWQHIRTYNEQRDKPFRILITSETNLAVDNALEKLKQGNQVMLKPIRIGSLDRIDKEGRFYSLHELINWNEKESNEEVDDNILDHWVSIVANRSLDHSTVKNHKSLKKWRNWLLSKNRVVRLAFFKNYIHNVNIIGATCSSIGKNNSVGNFTRFFQEYCEVFFPKEYARFDKERNRVTAAQLSKLEIEFDLVIQDEASKATPPELALPYTFARKAIIIGDHRQLPPITDLEELKNSLNRVLSESDEYDLRKEMTALIKFVNNNVQEIQKSHFERLFVDLTPILKTSFDTQYRMHPGINEIIKQFYVEDGGLKCGISEKEANTPDLSNSMSRYHGLTKSNNTHVVWIETKSPEMIKGTSRFNLGEVDAIDLLLTKLSAYEGYHAFLNHWPINAEEERQIGIITFYGAQTSELKKLEDKHSTIPLRISPVDRFQGMERNVVIVSLVRSNCIAQSPNQMPDYEMYGELGFPSQTSLGFAEFPNRLNVALSRAKRLLVIVGNSDHFRKNTVYDNVYKAIQESPYGRVMSADLL